MSSVTTNYHRRLTCKLCSHFIERKEENNNNNNNRGALAGFFKGGLRIKVILPQPHPFHKSHTPIWLKIDSWWNQPAPLYSRLKHSFTFLTLVSTLLWLNLIVVLLYHLEECLLTTLECIQPNPEVSPLSFVFPASLVHVHYYNFERNNNMHNELRILFSF